MRKNINWVLVGIGIGATALIAWRVAHQADDESNGDKRVAQQITCVNNLKQIGIAFKFGRATTAISTRSMSARTPAARWNFARLAETVLTAIRFCIFWSRRMN